MGIEYRFIGVNEKKLWEPIFVCDVCGEIIHSSGIVEYKVKITEVSKSEDIKKLYFVHNQNNNGIFCGKTLRDISTSNENEIWHWEDLDNFSTQLFVNFIDLGKEKSFSEVVKYIMGIFRVKQ